MNQALIQHLEEKVGRDGHVIWDWNGTLLSDVEHAVTSVNHLLEHHGLSAIDVARYRQLFEFPVINYYRALGFDFSKESFESLCDRFVTKFMAGFRELPLMPGMDATLRSLKHAGFRQSILSATVQSDLDVMVEHFGLAAIFERAYGINNRLAGSKIERGFELMKRAETPPEKTIMVGDTLHDLEVAEALGIQAVLLAHGHQCVTRLKSRHPHVLEMASDEVLDTEFTAVTIKATCARIQTE